MDRALRVQLLRAVVSDRAFLKQAWRDVDPAYFTEPEEAMVAKLATTFYEKYEEPIGSMLATEVDDAIREGKYAKNTRTRLLEKSKALQRELRGADVDRVSVRALADRVKRLHRQTFYETALEDILTANDEGKLSAEILAGIVEKASAELTSATVIGHEYFKGLEDRISRRSQWDSSRIPMFMIEPLDSKIQCLSKGQLGVWLAPPGGGKGLALLHMTLAYAMQGLNVIHFTLEDPLALVENRMDACISGLPLGSLRKMPNTLRKRFRRAVKKIRGRIRIVDGTGDEAFTVTKMERVYEQFKQDGFVADAMIMDYDDEIKCEVQFKGESARRFEFAEIYKRLRRMCAKLNIIGWTGAQTTKAAESKKIITGRDTAEDFSKIRKVFMALTIGSDPEYPGMRYIYIPKNRVDRGRFGVEIMSDYEAAMFYDGEATKLMQRTKKKDTRGK